MSSQDKRAQFVGIEAYEAAGGIVRRDLFDPKDGGFFEDAALLDWLTQDKLDAAPRASSSAPSNSTGPRILRGSRPARP